MRALRQNHRIFRFLLTFNISACWHAQKPAVFKKILCEVQKFSLYEIENPPFFSLETLCSIHLSSLTQALAGLGIYSR